jgi:methyl-accepting chemotaxis protein
VPRGHAEAGEGTVARWPDEGPGEGPDDEAREAPDLRALAMAAATTPLRLLDLARRVPLVDVAEALLRLPLELERNVRTTNELIEATSAQLEVLRGHTDALVGSAEALAHAAGAIAATTPGIRAAAEAIAETTPGIRAAAEQLAETTPGISEAAGQIATTAPVMAEGAGAIAAAVPGVVDTVAATTAQLAETTAALGRVGDTLQEVLKRVEAVERAGQRIGRLIDRKGG